MGKAKSLINHVCRLNIYEGEIIKNYNKNNNKKSIEKKKKFFNVVFNKTIKKGNITPGLYIGIKNDMLMGKRI